MGDERIQSTQFLPNHCSVGPTENFGKFGVDMLFESGHTSAYTKGDRQ